jgi:hypothetical protein
MENKNNQDLNGQINVELSAEIAEGLYSNLAVISHSNSEFILDFIRLMPGLPSAKVKSRIIMTPQHIKRLHLALQENIDRFESSFGEISLQDQAVPPMRMTGPMGLA